MTTTHQPAPDPVGWRFDNTYARLPADLFAPATPATAADPRVVVLNHDLADDLGLSLRELPRDAAAALFAGQHLPAGAASIAQAYAGHQYGGFTVLGDGRAILLGEHRTPDGRLVDVQFKGSGPTRFSRRGDGLAALGPMLREYVIGEAMHALGIPTTRALAVVTTGGPVYRETARRGAILTRVAASHVRVGTFEYAARVNADTLRALADYAIARHDPELAADPQKYLAFFAAACGRQAALVARWQAVGFVHGVLNTDNVAISGETIDFGPCAFMDAYDPATVFSSIDRGGRYAYGNQPAITQWNLARFAETLLPLIAPDPETAVAAATAELEAFAATYERHRQAAMRAKLGLTTHEDGDAEIIESLLAWTHAAKADFTNTFRDLSSGTGPTGDLYQAPEFRRWHANWTDRLARDGRPLDTVFAGMRAVNPAVIPRNHVVEIALNAAEDANDLTPLHTLVAALRTPFEDPADPAFRRPDPDGAGYRTFCGT